MFYIRFTAIVQNPERPLVPFSAHDQLPQILQDFKINKQNSLLVPLTQHNITGMFFSLLLPPLINWLHHLTRIVTVWA